jgi:hypothetical protein
LNNLTAREFPLPGFLDIHVKTFWSSSSLLARLEDMGP